MTVYHTLPATSAPQLVPVMSLRGVSKSFGDQQVLSNINLDIWPGETVVLLGESGCGKSVTMKLLMALFRPDAGEVLWRGEDVHRWGRSRLTRERLRFGYLFQGAALFDSLDVFDNVAFGLRRNVRLKKQQIRQIVLDQIRAVGLDEDVFPKRPAELSGGMQKRVALARAMALAPQVMFYDEPTTGLDPVMSATIDELILRASRQQRVTGIIVTHDLRTVERVAHRVLMFVPLAQAAPGHSQVIFNGTPQELFESHDPRVAAFVRGEPEQTAA